MTTLSRLLFVDNVFQHDCFNFLLVIISSLQSIIVVNNIRVSVIVDVVSGLIFKL